LSKEQQQMGDITKLLRMSSMHEHIHQKDLKVNGNDDVAYSYKYST